MKKVDNSILSKKHGSFADPLFDEKYSIINDAFDIDNFNELKESAAEIGALGRKGEKDYEQFPELYQDVYSSFYRYNAGLLPEYQMDHNFLLNNAVMSNLTESQKFKELRAMTKLDTMATAIATEVFGREALEMANELKEKQDAINRAIQDALDAAKKLQEEEEAAEGTGEDGDGKGTGEAGDGEGEESGGPSANEISLKEAEKALQEAYKDVSAWAKKDLSKDINRAMSTVIQRTSDTLDTLKQWGLGAGGGENIGYRQQMELFNKIKNSHKMKEIAKIAGRLRMIATKVCKEKIKRGSDEVYLARILPSELCNMRSANKGRRNLFKIDFIEGKLLQFALSGQAKKSKGPIICCIDESGSMNGMPEYWAKALALSLLDIAQKEHRDFMVIHYSGEHSVEQLRVHDFPKEEGPNTQKTIEMAELFLNGGTNFEPPLTLSMQYIDSKPAFSKADIIFITDGESPLRADFVEKFNKWTKEKKVSVISLLVDTGWHTAEVLNTISRLVIKMSDIYNQNAESEIALNIFATMS